MANPNSRTIDDSISHQVRLLRLAASIGANARAILTAADEHLLDFLAKHLRRLLSAPPVTQLAMRGQIGIAVDEITAEAFDAVQGRFLTDAADLARYEADFQSRMISRAAGKAVNVELDRAALEQVLAAPIMGRSIPEQMDDAAAARALKVKQAIGKASTSGGTLDDALKAIQGTEDAALRDGQLQGAREWLDTLAATDTAGVADAAGRQVYVKSGAVRGELWVSVLDSHTTPVCRANSQAQRKLGEKRWTRTDGTFYDGPYPAHWGERSVIVPMIGANPVPDIVTYPEWLKAQPEEKQLEALGAVRLRLFKDGRLPLSALVDQRGRPLTLDELRANEGEAFKRAGLSDAT